jgi:catechol 2,3-dioxygenase-like lactoylglutathione lyase family enzyme
MPIDNRVCLITNSYKKIYPHRLNRMRATLLFPFSVSKFIRLGLMASFFKRVCYIRSLVSSSFNIDVNNMTENVLMTSCIPVIPSADLEKSLRFWVDGLGLSVDREMRYEGKLIGCMVHNEHIYCWLNKREGTPIKQEDYEGIRLYWAPVNIHQTRERLKRLGYDVSEIAERDYGQTEFFVTDDDGHSHCFGVATEA